MEHIVLPYWNNMLVSYMLLLLLLLFLGILWEVVIIAIRILIIAVWWLQNGFCVEMKEPRRKETGVLSKGTHCNCCGINNAPIPIFSAALNPKIQFTGWLTFSSLLFTFFSMYNKLMHFQSVQKFSKTVSFDI